MIALYAREVLTHMKTHLTILAAAAVCLSCGATDVAQEAAWRDPNAMNELFAAHQGKRYALWIELINRMSQDRKVTIAEIGVWEGKFAQRILRNCPNVERYYLVDPWRHLGDWNKPASLPQKVVHTLPSALSMPTTSAPRMCVRQKSWALPRGGRRWLARHA